jgi:hypothetical protein
MSGIVALAVKADTRGLDMIAPDMSTDPDFIFAI